MLSLKKLLLEGPRNGRDINARVKINPRDFQTSTEEALDDEHEQRWEFDSQDQSFEDFKENLQQEFVDTVKAFAANPSAALERRVFNLRQRLISRLAAREGANRHNFNITDKEMTADAINKVFRLYVAAMRD